MAMTNNATGKGGFVRGKSGNPNGRPKKPESERRRWEKFKASARDKSVDGIAYLVTVMGDPDEKTTDRIRATQLLLGYGWGAPGPAEIPAEELVNLDTATPEEKIRVFRRAIRAEEDKLHPVVCEGTH